jgi:hypothetical protein
VYHLIEKNEFYKSAAVTQAHDWVEAYDALERNWPHSRSRHTPSLIQAAERMTKRRRHHPVPPRLAFKSTIDYYEAIMPLMLAQRRWEETTNLRYVRPLMIRVMLRRWLK